MTYPEPTLTMKQRLRRWLGIDELRRDLNKVRDIAGTTEGQMDATIMRHNRLRREMEELGVLATSTKDALGGMYWTTKSGFTRPIVLLSDTHLQAMIDGGFVRGRVLDAVLAEQERRDEDDVWADRQGQSSLRNRVQRLEERLEEVTPVAPRRGPLNFEMAKPGDEQVLLSALFRALIGRER